MLFSQCTKCVDAVCLADRSVGSRRAEEIKAYVWPQLHRLRVLVIDTLRVVACIAQPAFQHAIAKACCHCECQVSAGRRQSTVSTCFMPVHFLNVMRHHDIFYAQQTAPQAGLTV